jgi:hypothetical protein
MERGRVDADVLKAVGRMGGSEYTRTGDRFAMERPVLTEQDPRSVASQVAARIPVPVPGAKGRSN